MNKKIESPVLPVRFNRNEGLAILSEDYSLNIMTNLSEDEDSNSEELYRDLIEEDFGLKSATENYVCTG